MNKLSLIFLIALAALVAPAAAGQSPAPSAPATTSAAAPAAASEEDCGCETAPLPEVLAVVNGVKITRDDISPEVRQRAAQLRRQVVEARRRELDLQINDRLLEAEAKRRGVSTAKLIETEIVAKTAEPTEAEAQALYDENKARIEGEFKDVKAQLLDYLRDLRRRARAESFSDSLRAAYAVKKNVEFATPPADAAERARVLASVNGRDITSADIEDGLRALVFNAQEEIYNLRRQDVELKINDLLLGHEAQKRGVTARALLEAEVAAKVKPATEADAQKFYDENRDRIGGDFAQTKQQIIQHLQETESRKLLSALASRLRGAAQVQTFLTPPAPPVFAIATDDQPAKGNPKAAVTVVEFTDFQCPSCAQTQPVIERLANEYGDRVRLVIRDFPLSQHAHAQKAAEAAEAAREQGKYWEFAAVLFRNQSALQVEKMKEYASQLGLDRAKFDAALDSGKFAEQVRRDLRDGERLGVNATPTIFVNGRRVADRSYEGLKAVIEAALQASAAK